MPIPPDLRYTRAYALPRYIPLRASPSGGRIPAVEEGEVEWRPQSSPKVPVFLVPIHREPRMSVVPCDRIYRWFGGEVWSTCYSDTTSTVSNPRSPVVHVRRPCQCAVKEVSTRISLSMKPNNCVLPPFVSCSSSATAFKTLSEISSDRSRPTIPAPNSTRPTTGRRPGVIPTRQEVRRGPQCNFCYLCVTSRHSPSSTISLVHIGRSAVCR